MRLHGGIIHVRPVQRGPTGADHIPHHISTPLTLRYATTGRLLALRGTTPSGFYTACGLVGLLSPFSIYLSIYLPTPSVRHRVWRRTRSRYEVRDKRANMPKLQSGGR